MFLKMKKFQIQILNLWGSPLKVEIERALSKLTKREAEVIRLYFGIGREHSLTLEEIGERFDLSEKEYDK